MSSQQDSQPAKDARQRRKRKLNERDAAQQTSSLSENITPAILPINSMNIPMSSKEARYSRKIILAEKNVSQPRKRFKYGCNSSSNPLYVNSNSAMLARSKRRSILKHKRTTFKSANQHSFRIEEPHVTTLPYGYSTSLESTTAAQIYTTPNSNDVENIPDNSDPCLMDSESDAADSEYVSNEDTSDDSADDTDYEDLGEASHKCASCNAFLWYNEKVGKQKIPDQLQFSLCCMKGKISLPKSRDPPSTLSELMFNHDETSKHFQEHVRSYNMMFSFTSLGGKIQTSINNGAAPYTFLLHGQNYHRIGSLLPEQGSSPKFAQLYIFDTEHEIDNRIRAVRSKTGTYNLDHHIVQTLKEMLDRHNILAQSYRAARDRFSSDGLQGVKLKLIRNRNRDNRTYNLPSANEIAALIVGDFDNQQGERDIIVETQSKELKHISELHPLYLPLQYPLLFPYGEDGYTENIPLNNSEYTSSNKRTNMSMREYFAYLIHRRWNERSLLISSRKLFQQFLVDAYAMIESSRLNYIRHNQQQLRVEMYKGIQDRILRGDSEGTSTGMRIILPGTFVGGPRYMFNNFVDALQICNWIGFPTLFITFTCNPQWNEIQREVKASHLRAEDRPDVICRVFKMKLDLMLKDFKKGDIFGRARAHVCTIEFQKRGLPHAHILLWLNNENKPKTTDDIDRMICAEIPSKNTDRTMYKLVKKYMMHGPCGEQNPKSPCMHGSKCSKRFPKQYVERTMSDDDGYPLYRRRRNRRTVKKKKIPLDNGFVVPYNRTLLAKYRAHINVELCNQNKSIKYLFKYVNKGHDRVTAAFYQSSDGEKGNKERDEIKMYYDCRYLSACEAAWRILGFEIHYREPPVVRLQFHLPDSQNVTFNDCETLKKAIDKPSAQNTMFLAWFEANKTYPNARNIRYVDFPEHFVYKKDTFTWEPRKKGFSIGRIMHVHPGTGEDYYLRLLLNIQRGCTCYEDIRTVNNVVYTSFKEACYHLGLLEDDREYIDAIKESNDWASAHYVRKLFVILLLSNCLARPEHVWDTCWQYFADDILYRQQKIHNNPRLSLSDESLKNYALIEIEHLLQSNGKSLKHFQGMPIPIGSRILDEHNMYVLEELQYDRFEMLSKFQQYMSTINPEQKMIFDQIMVSITKNKGALYFIYGHGGTGKTYLWQTLSAAIRSQGEIVINVASSGIASLLLPGGRTAHSRFSLPLLIKENSTCTIKKQSPKAELLQKAKLIIWDEAPMMHRYCFEALDRTMRDILGSNKPFGGKVVVLGGDFRQILPVLQKASRQDIVHASINSSLLWKYCKVLLLQRNMRVQPTSLADSGGITTEFANWVLNIGNGEIGEPNDGECSIDIPSDMLVPNCDDPFKVLIDFVYPNIINNMTDASFFKEKAILAPTNDLVEVVNDYLLALLPGQSRTYLSSDTICNEDAGSEDNGEIFSTEFLNTITCSGLPSHKLTLKEGIPVMLIRNIDQSRGLCNGTRLIVINLGTHLINCRVLTGKNAGDTVFVPRMSLVPSNTSLPIKFQRRQFPIVPSFAMTINKSQGQTLSHVGLYLPKPVFSHGQLYVALSRVRNRNGIKILIKNSSGEVGVSTDNVVFKEIFHLI